MPKPTTSLTYLSQQSLLPTTGTSADLQQLDAAITERAFFCAQVDRADVLQRAKDLTARMLNPDADGPGDKITAPAFRREMRALLTDVGYQLNPEGELVDITSTKRLNLIAEMNASEARGYGQFEAANNPAVLSAFPAQELFRLQSRRVPRHWLDKWLDAGGKLYSGRMIALKDDPIWTKRMESGGFNRFGRPWPPFDFNSGMWVKPVPRGLAVRLGVCSKTTTPKQQKRTYNATLQQACRPLSPVLQNLLKKQLGRLITIDAAGTVHFNAAAEAAL